MDTDDAEAGGGEIRVHFLPLSLAGRLGFTMAPGRRGRDAEGRFWTRDLEEDLDRLAHVVRVDHVVSLLTEEELSAGRISGLTHEVEARGIAFTSHALSPKAPPADPHAIGALVDRLRSEIEAGRTVAVVSADGLGRAPLLAGCFLVRQGFSVSLAQTLLQRLRGPECLADPLLVDFLERFAAASSTTERPTQPLGHSQEAPRLEPSSGPPQTAGAHRVAALYGHAAPRMLETRAPEPPPTRIGQIPSGGPPTAWTPFESACVGSILALAVGDALGAPLEEERDRSVLEARYGPEGPREPQLSRPPSGGVPQALVSDDTQLAECAIETLIESRQRRLELESTLSRLAERLARWARQPRGGHRNPEPGCLAACEQLAEGRPWAETGQNGSLGSAGLPRAAAFGLAFHDDLPRAEQWAAAQSRITHRAPASVAAAAALAVGVARCIAGGRLDEVLSEMVAVACRGSPQVAVRLATALHDADLGVPPEVRFGRSSEHSAPDALASAMFVIRRHPDDLEIALREAVLTSGDSDAVAGSVGALLGARLGAGALPPTWMQVLEGRRNLEALALALAASR